MDVQVFITFIWREIKKQQLNIAKSICSSKNEEKNYKQKVQERYIFIRIMYDYIFY